MPPTEMSHWNVTSVPTPLLYVYLFGTVLTSMLAIFSEKTATSVLQMYHMGICSMDAYTWFTMFFSLVSGFFSASYHFLFHFSGRCLNKTGIERSTLTCHYLNRNVSLVVCLKTVLWRFISRPHSLSIRSLFSFSDSSFPPPSRWRRSARSCSKRGNRSNGHLRRRTSVQLSKYSKSICFAQIFDLFVLSLAPPNFSLSEKVR